MGAQFEINLSVTVIFGGEFGPGQILISARSDILVRVQHECVLNSILFWSYTLLVTDGHVFGYNMYEEVKKVIQLPALAARSHRGMQSR